MRISYSALESFQTCPLKYKFNQIDKIKEPKTKEQVFGNYLHQVLKWFYEKDPHFPTLEELIDYYYKHWPKESEGYKWTNEMEEKDYFEEGLRILRNYYKTNFPVKSIILDLETKFEAVIDEKPQKPGGLHILTGIVDRVDKLEDGTLEVIDYKSSKRMSSKEDLDKNLQLSIYAIGLKHRWPKIEYDKMKFSLYFLKFNEKMESQRTEEDIKKAEEKVIDLIHQIQNSSFEPKPSAFCHWCGYKSICPVWRHLFEEKNQKDLNEIEVEEKIDEYFALKEKEGEIKEQLKEIKTLIDVYSLKKGLKRVYGKNGYFSQSVINKVSYDFEKVKKILEPLGKWEEVLEIEPEKLEKVLKEIPAPYREEIEKAKNIEKRYRYLETNNKPKEEFKEEFQH
ncbi:MAG TPA: PD-(D/E)XK nuclease family protein [Candidatus Paceibacterota bacterium]|nr:PD-(D/E)XK nuclease family protein [Candidatus Paceibacterota bacterium]HOK97203.1 PD-(D/E)XK nuclease family protein [Candidatus Paceibacterota bacterium]HPP64606.1 PD-(D/E)XK nuclease family protein [Candidatus Paceibacterota bacterium]